MKNEQDYTDCVNAVKSMKKTIFNEESTLGPFQTQRIKIWKARYCGTKTDSKVDGKSYGKF